MKVIKDKEKNGKNLYGKRYLVPATELLDNSKSGKCGFFKLLFRDVTVITIILALVKNCKNVKSIFTWGRLIGPWKCAEDCLDFVIDFQ